MVALTCDVCEVDWGGLPCGLYGRSIKRTEEHQLGGGFTKGVPLAGVCSGKGCLWCIRQRQRHHKKKSGCS